MNKVSKKAGRRVRQNVATSSLIMALEPRLMFDGAAAVDVVEAVAKPEANKEVAFVDTSVKDYKTLEAGIKDGVEIVEINSRESGLAQIAQWAQSHQGYDAVHILSHGSEGRVILGSDWLDSQSLNDATTRAELAALGHALNPDGDILLYGCNVGKGDDGQDFINALAKATGADIAASDDNTGAADKGGDWELEEVVGSIEVAAHSAYSFADVLSVSGCSVSGQYWDGNAWAAWGDTTEIGSGLYWDTSNGIFSSEEPAVGYSIGHF